MSYLVLVATERANEPALLIEMVQETVATVREGEDVICACYWGRYGRRCWLVALGAGFFNVQEILHVDFRHFGVAVIIVGTRRK